MVPPHAGGRRRVPSPVATGEGEGGGWSPMAPARGGGLGSDRGRFLVGMGFSGGHWGLRGWPWLGDQLPDRERGLPEQGHQDGGPAALKDADQAQPRRPTLAALGTKHRRHVEHGTAGAGVFGDTPHTHQPQPGGPADALDTAGITTALVRQARTAIRDRWPRAARQAEQRRAQFGAAFADVLAAGLPQPAAQLLPRLIAVEPKYGSFLSRHIVKTYFVSDSAL